MDIEQLTKAQIVLLTLLVSFITSIATGIVTVSLMDQAPPAMTQVVNRVVERTVERVVPDSTQTASAGTVQKEVTVVVKENDLITEAIEKNAKTLVHINKKADSRTLNPGVPVGIGFIVRADGIIATDSSLLAPRGEYIITTSEGAYFAARVASDVAKSPIALLAMQRSSNEVFPEAKLADIAGVKLGQTALSLSGEKRVNVAIGNITDIEHATTPPGDATRITTNLQDTKISYGAPLFNMFGEIVGIHTAMSQTQGEASFSPMPALSTLLKNEEPKKP